MQPQPFVSRRLGRWGGAARCVYCGARCAARYLACVKHQDLPNLDPRYYGAGWER